MIQCVYNIADLLSSIFQIIIFMILLTFNTRVLMILPCIRKITGHYIGLAN